MPEEYDQAFYHNTSAAGSAAVIVPHLLALTGCRSVVDVGCGDGTWLRTFLDHGVEEVLGVDGDYVDHAWLKIPADRFRSHDLSTPLDFDRTYDLAMCLEVAEHLSPERADSTIEMLCALAPVVYFSGAIPHQGGTCHINEQWQTRWVEKFEARGFAAIDCIRPLVWNREDVQFWYCQNSALFVRRDIVEKDEALRRELERTNPAYWNLVHPRLFELHMRALEPETTSLRRIAPLIVPGIRRSILRRVSRG